MALLIFSFGVLGIVGLQTAAIASASEAKYRSEAGFFVNRLLGEMGAADRISAEALSTFTTSGKRYNDWYDDIKNAKSTSGLLGLPGAAANPPEVTIKPISNALVPRNPTTGLEQPVSYDVMVTVKWQAPGSPGNPVHRHVVSTSISAD